MKAIQALFGWNKDKAADVKKAPPTIVKEIVLKILVLGAPEVGKSSITWQYVRQCFSSLYYPTYGVELLTTCISDPKHPLLAISGGVPIRVNFWDVPYPEIKGRHAKQILSRAHGVITVFNGSCSRTVEVVDEWRTIQQKLMAGKAPPMALVAHKNDLRKSLISTSDLDTYCEKSGISFWRSTSVFEPKTIVEAVEDLLTMALRQHLDEEARRAQRRQEAAERAARERCLDADVNKRPPEDADNSELLAKKVLDLQVDVEDFYGRRLLADLSKLRDMAAGAPISRSIDVFEEQRSDELRKFLGSINRVQQESTGNVSYRLRYVEKLQMGLLEKIDRWKVLVAQLTAEIGVQMPEGYKTMPPAMSPTGGILSDPSMSPQPTFSPLVGNLPVPTGVAGQVPPSASGSAGGSYGSASHRRMGFLFRNRRGGSQNFQVADYEDQPGGPYSTSPDMMLPTPPDGSPLYYSPSRFGTPGPEFSLSSTPGSLSDYSPAEY